MTRNKSAFGFILMLIFGEFSLSKVYDTTSYVRSNKIRLG